MQTGIVDAGFQPHPDLSRLHELTLCKLGLCTQSPPSSHGNGTAGIIGADFGNAQAPTVYALGVDGVNPVAQMYGLGSHGFGTLDGGFRWFFSGDAVTIFTALLDEKTASLPNLRLINFSMGFHLPPASYLAKFPNNTCGPSDNDDEDPATVPGTKTPCTFDNEDRHLREVAHSGRAIRKVAERAADLGVVIVASAGNESTSTTPVRADHVTDFPWAARNWLAGRPNPIIVAEAIGGSGVASGLGGGGSFAAESPGLSRSSFSNVGGDVSGPGTAEVSTGLPGVPSSIPGVPEGYERFNGTSMAAPFVTGLIGYLLAFHPTLTIQQIREAVINHARADTTGIGGEAVAPRIDAFASVMSLPGAVRALVDVNDLSKDGNRRTVRGPDNTITAPDTTFSSRPGYLTEPDGKIDMRDFRRFRDAWLQTCAQSPTNECATLAPHVTLDGASDHPKKDANFDGCVNPIGAATHLPCPTAEGTFPRFDFNGDGTLSRTRTVDVVPVRPDPASPPGTLLSATDLDVLKSLWESRSTTDDAQIEALTEGWKTADLDALMVSGDLHIHAPALFSAGATEVKIVTRELTTGRILPTRTLRPADDHLVITVPLSPPTATVEIQGFATIGGATVESGIQRVTLKPGEDRRVDLVSGTPVHYVWRQRVRSLWINGSTMDDCRNTFDWYCVDQVGTNTNWVLAEQPLPELHRRGTLTPAGASSLVTEDASAALDLQLNLSLALQDWGSSSPIEWYYLRPFNAGPYESTWPSQPDPEQLHLRLLGADVGPLDTTPRRYQDHPVSGTVVQERADGIILSGLRNLGELAYRYQYSRDHNGGTFDYLYPSSWFGPTPPLGTAPGFTGRADLTTDEKIDLYAAIPPDVLLVPRGDGSAIRFASDVNQTITFPRNADGTYQPYVFCGSTRRTFSLPGFRSRPRSSDATVLVSADSVISAHVADRLAFDANAAPAIAGSFAVEVDYAFAAVPGGAGTAISLPVCPEPTPPATPTPSPTATSTAT
ncbi:MAG TPA: S8 family serine peptidase, partial [Chloroflexota bacterium]|nr:S8 family serine peptidase [Chloroflexota bacterium]